MCAGEMHDAAEVLPTVLDSLAEAPGGRSLVTASSQDNIMGRGGIYLTDTTVQARCTMLQRCCPQCWTAWPRHLAGAALWTPCSAPLSRCRLAPLTLSTNLCELQQGPFSSEKTQVARADFDQLLLAPAHPARHSPSSAHSWQLIGMQSGAMRCEVFLLWHPVGWLPSMTGMACLH